ncbi:MAG: DNA methyltransferase [Acetobacteraceae bacterium]|nr:DNA methyltransferase [Acetobacteraceae bacterium]
MANDDAAALPLEADDIALLQRVSALDWAEVDPSILGTLFERGLDPDKRSQLGAHYTSREMIERLIEPVVRRPLLAEWSEVQAQIAAAGAAAKPGRRAKRDALRRAETLFRGFLDRLRAFRVLDPACGSGNFLYLALLALKDLEHQAMVEAVGQLLQAYLVPLGHCIGPVGANGDALDVGRDQQRRVFQRARVLQELPVRGVQVLMLPLVLPGEPPAPPHVRPALAAASLGGTFLEGIGCAGWVGVGRRFVQRRAQVQEMLLRGGTLVAGIGSPFGDDGRWGHAKRLSRVIPISVQRAPPDFLA